MSYISYEYNDVKQGEEKAASFGRDNITSDTALHQKIESSVHMRVYLCHNGIELNFRALSTLPICCNLYIKRTQRESSQVFKKEKREIENTFIINLTIFGT